MQAQQAAEQSRQFGAGQGLQAAGLGAQYGQAAEQLGEQSRQFGANLGMQGLTTGLQAAGTLGNLGQTQYGQQMGINQLQQQTGATQQALEQQGLSQAYQDFLNQQNYPYKQLGFMSDLIRGLPLGQQSAQQIYQAPGSISGQLAGLGLGAYGMSRAFGGFNEGGAVYAEGGVTDDRNVEDILSNLSDVQLAQAKQAALNARDQAQLKMIEDEMAERASMRRGLGSIPVDFAAFMPDEQSMARGGIVAFAEPTEENNYSLVSDPMGTGATEMSAQPVTTVDTRNFFERMAGAPIEPAWKTEARKESAERQRLEKSGKAPSAKDKEIMEKAQAELKAKADAEAKAAETPVAPPKAPAKSISEAARIVTDVAKTEVPKDDVNKLYEDILGKMKSTPGPEAEALSRLLDKAERL